MRLERINYVHVICHVSCYAVHCPPASPIDLQHQLQQLNISQRSGGDTSPERQGSPTQSHISGRASPTSSGNSSRKPSIGAPAPPPQSMMTQYLGAHLPILGAAASGTRGGIPGMVRATWRHQVGVSGGVPR